MRMLTLTCVISLLTSTAAAQDKLTYVDLVKRLTDLERLATLPQPGEKCLQWASWDRRSKYDAKTGKYVNWGANGDGTGIIREDLARRPTSVDGVVELKKEGDRIVMAEMKGPGCIWRIWSARATAGHVKIYLDGAEEPAVDLPFIQYFDRTAEPFVYPSLCYTAARGLNSYVPIPFAKSCKIVAEKNWGRYYHFTYSLFPKGTQVPTFSMKLSEAETDALKAADDFLTNKFGTDPAGKRSGQKTEGGVFSAPPGKAMTVLDLKGPRAITGIQLDIPPITSKRDGMKPLGLEEQRAALRELVLRITWDDEKTPAVWCPVGDFFGTAPGVNKYKSLPMGMIQGEGEPYCFWYMPFAKRAKVELINDGKEDRTVECTFTHAPLTRPIEKLGRFHAKWHRDAFLPKEKERAIDWTMLTTTGRGRFVGVMLHVWNPRGGWWGEGDEKFFVDGEKFPSTFGTGSEDYFGYAWCNPTLFARAYHNQTISQGNRGHISLNRWHVADNVPFQKSFEATIEKYYPNTKPTLYAATAYWYQAPGGKDPYPAVPVDERWGYCVGPKIHRVKGAVEGERLKILERTGGQSQAQDMGNFNLGKWSGVSQLWWRDGKVGDKLVLALPVEKAGKYELKARLTKAIDYGIVQLYLDDKKVGEPIDLFNDGVIPTDELALGVHELTKGRHKLTVEIVGINEKAAKKYMFGLDYVLLKPQE